MVSRHDLVVIGGGTAGMIAAVGAAGVGARVLLAEEARTGGDCLWTGCVPSKSLIAAARRAHDMRTADCLGLSPVAPEVDLARIMARVHDVIAALEPHDSPERLRACGVEVVASRARFLRPGQVEVDGRRVAYRSALIATGSAPSLPAVEGLQAADPLTSETLWDLREVPRRLAVLGGGAVGCELGQAFARLGSQVTIIEMTPRLLPLAEPEASGLVAQVLRREGVDVRTSTRALAVRPDHLVLAGPDRTGGSLEFDRLLVATGRTPRTGGLGLERVAVETDERGFVRVDDTMRTTGRRIFAAGDVTGRMPFTHVAAAHAGLVVTNALFHLRRTTAEQLIPWTIFTDPEVAQVGISEAAARQRWGSRAIVAHHDYAHVDRAVTQARTTGFAKLVAGPRGRLVGATVVGEAAGESIAELSAWIRRGATLREIGDAVHAYPTLTEGPWRAALEHLRGRWLSPRVRRLTRPVLWLLRHLAPG